MKKKLALAISVVLLAGLGGCGPAAAPTLSAADIQLTGVALAWTGLALTQVAMRTATPLPPTSIQLPTVAPLPTLAFGIPTPGIVGPLSSPTPDNCTLPPPLKPKGNQTLVTFQNKSGGSVILSWAMNKPNGQGECGTYSFGFGKYASPTEKVLAGCYSAYAWVATPTKNIMPKSISTMCLTVSTRNYAVVIGTDLITLKP